VNKEIAKAVNTLARKKGCAAQGMGSKSDVVCVVWVELLHANVGGALQVQLDKQPCHLRGLTMEEGYCLH